MVSNQQVVDHFLKNVRSIHDSDYGDFMRKSNTYFNRMLEHFQNSDDQKKQILLKIKTQIQYSPNRDIEQSLVVISHEAEKLKKLL